MTTVTFDLNRPLALPAVLRWRPVDGAYLCLAPEQPNWLVTDRLGMTLLTALGWGETPQAALRFVVRTTGTAPEVARATLKKLLGQIERQHFYADAPVQRFDSTTAKRMLHVYLTRRCNLRCPQCYVDAGRRGMQELTTGEWHRVLDTFTRVTGPSLVSFSGGEPLLRPDLFQLAVHARDQGHRLSLMTNGTLISDAPTAHRLAGPFDWIQLSLDGATPAIHDAIRGAGSFRRTLQALHWLLQQDAAGGANVRLRIAVTVMPGNAADLSAHLGPLLAQLPCKEGNRPNIAVNRALPEGRARSGALCADPARTGEAAQQILGQLQTAGWAKERAQRPRRPRHNCGYGGAVVVAADGDVYPCPILHQPVGNTRSTGLETLVAQLEHVYRQNSVDRMAECANCDLRYVCGGGCRIQNLRQRGNLQSPSCTEATRQSLYQQLVATTYKDKSRITQHFPR